MRRFDTRGHDSTSPVLEVQETWKEWWESGEGLFQLGEKHAVGLGGRGRGIGAFW